MHILLCSPVLMPQMVGGFGPSGLLTLKVSVRHCPKLDTPTLLASEMALKVTEPPFGLLKPTVIMLTLGPVMVNWSNSSFNCK